MWSVEYLPAAIEEEAKLPATCRPTRPNGRSHSSKRVAASSARLGEAARRQALGVAVTVRDGIARAIYVTATGQRVVILRIFVKKTQKTPARELELARRRAKEVS
jgi:hypothetical protein